mgnify:CR=1 FL=1
MAQVAFQDGNHYKKVQYTADKAQLYNVSLTHQDMTLSREEG